MSREQTATVSFAPEPGEVNPFERLCFRCYEVDVRMLTDGSTTWVELEVRAVADDDQTLLMERCEQPLTADDGTPIDFPTALTLASLQLLARLNIDS